MCNIETLDKQSKSDKLEEENHRLQQTIKYLRFVIKDLTLDNAILCVEKQTLVYEVTRLQRELSVFKAAGFQFPDAWAGEPMEIWRDNG